jgi:hypothetical protein
MASEQSPPGPISRHSFDGYPRTPRDADATSVTGASATIRDRDSLTDESPAAFRVLLAEDSRANQMAISR